MFVKQLQKMINNIVQKKGSEANHLHEFNDGDLKNLRFSNDTMNAAYHLDFKQP